MEDSGSLPRRDPDRARGRYVQPPGAKHAHSGLAPSSSNESPQSSGPSVLPPKGRWPPFRIHHLLGITVNTSTEFQAPDIY